MDKRASRLAALAASTMTALLAANPANALTGADVIDKMSEDESNGYLFGVMETTAYLSFMAGDKERSRCIQDWFTKEDGNVKILRLLERHPDREAMTIIHWVFNDACGETQ